MKKIFLVSLLGIFVFFSKADAHVGYVLTEEEFVANSGGDTLYILKALESQTTINITLSVILAVVLIAFIYRKSIFLKSWAGRVVDRLKTYDEFLPWAIRLSLGIALIGAGTAQVLVSPIEIATGSIAFIEILLGFFFMAGFLLIPSALLTIGLYIFGLSGNFYLLGNLDFLALAIAFLALHNERPGFDDIFNFKILHSLKIKRSLASPILRVGIGGAMMFLALYEKILNPHLSELVVNNFHLTSVIPVDPSLWVVGSGIVEFVIGLMLILGLFTRLSSIIAFGVLSLSFFFFKEAVYSHITLFGLLSILFVLGGGVWSLDSIIFGKSSPTVKAPNL